MSQDKPLSRIRNKSKYSRDIKQQAAAHYVTQGSAYKVARTLGVPRSTVEHWTQQEEWQQLTDDARQLYDETLKAKLRNIADRALDTVAAKVDKADAKGAAVCASIAIDKIRLLSGQPTSLTANFGDKAIAAFMQAAQANAVTAKPLPEVQTPVKPGADGA